MKPICCIIISGIMFLFLCAPAFAGTATMTFSCDTGLLNYKASGSGSLDSAGGRASFSGTNTTLLAQGGSPINSSSTVSLGMTLQPYGDAGSGGVGLVMIDSGGEDPLKATVSSDGTVTLTGYMGESVSTHFTYPAALNNTMTLTYDPSTDTATVTVTATPPQTRSVSLSMALFGNGSVQAGVFSNGTGGFGALTATGSSIPDYTGPVFGFVSLPGVGFKQLYDPMRLAVQVTAASTNVTYQWIKNGAPLSGETEPVYEVTSLLPADEGTYVCQVTDGCGIVHDTPPAVLKLLPEGSLPVGGPTVLCALAALMAVAAACVLRRRTVRL